MACVVCGTAKKIRNGNKPVYTKVNKVPSRHNAAIISIMAALIILIMQMNWIVVHVDVGRMSGDLMADIISHEDVLRIMQDAGIIGQFDNNINDLPNLIDMITSLRDTIDREIQTFYDSLHAFSLQDLLTGLQIVPPDIAGMIEIFSDLILAEVIRVSVNTGGLSQSISISDIPNLISLANFVTDVIVREGAGWGIGYEGIVSLGQSTEYIQTVEQYVLILRIIFAAIALLLIIFMYMLVAGLRPACIFGMVCLAIVFLLSGAFAATIFYGNRMLSDVIDDFICISAGWYVYATIGLSILAFVFTALHRKRLRD